MKLRNKYTGNIRDFESLNLIVRAEEPEDGFESWNDYRSLAEFNEEWEDYTSSEPLIKDEKIRKAVRAWAEATGTTSISYWGGELESEQNDSKIEFDDIAVVDFGDNYTIAELCGEEEE